MFRARSPAKSGRQARQRPHQIEPPRLLRLYPGGLQAQRQRFGLEFGGEGLGRGRTALEGLGKGRLVPEPAGGGEARVFGRFAPERFGAGIDVLGLQSEPARTQGWFVRFGQGRAIGEEQGQEARGLIGREGGCGSFKAAARSDFVGKSARVVGSYLPAGSGESGVNVEGRRKGGASHPKIVSSTN